MTESISNLFSVVLFRAMQTALDAVPTLLCGLLLAGVIRGMIGPQAVRQWFTDDPRTGPIRAWFTGLLLPVCSFGVLPIAWELRRAGVSRATVLTFLFAAPLANPFSLVEAFQTLEGEGPLGLAALAFLLIGSFVILVGMGVLLGLGFPEKTVIPDLPRLPLSGIHRTGVVILTVARGLNGPLLLFVATGIIGAALLAIVRGGALENAVRDRTVVAPMHLTLVSLPFQVAPARGMTLVSESLLSGVSFGSVFIVYLFGMGLNLGTLIWMLACYGARSLLFSMTILMGGALAIGYAAPITFPYTVPEDVKNLHFLEIESSGGYRVAKARAIRATLTNDAGEPQWFLIGACAALGVFWLAGIVSSSLGERGTLSRAMSRGAAEPPDRGGSAWSQHLTAPQRTLAGLVIVLTGVCAGLYLYYPAPTELLNEMDGIQVELSLSLKSEPVSHRRTIRLLKQWQRLQQKLVIADLLRRGSPKPRLRESTAQLRSAIDRLRVVIVQGSSPEEWKPAFIEAREATMRCRESLEEDRGSAVTIPTNVR